MPVVATRSQFIGHNIHLKVRHIQTKIIVGSPDQQSSHENDELYKKWIVEEEVLYTWILDSLSIELANRFIEYETVKEMWDVAS